MSQAVRDTQHMIASMAPELVAGSYVFCTTSDPALACHCSERAIGMFVEREGRSFILSQADAQSLGFACDLPMSRITLQVNSALDGVGLTAAVAGELARHGIPCNMVAAYHHDHLFVPTSMANDALAALQQLSAS